MRFDPIVNQPVIEADRFALRPLRRSDMGLLSLYAGDERVARNTSSIPHPLPPGAVEAFVDRSMSNDRIEDVWAMDGVASDNGELMGVIGLKRMDREQTEIGYWVAPAFWNTGLASEAVRVLLAANPQKARSIFASVFQDNPASAKVLTNVGFEYIGDAESFCVARDSTVATWTYILRLK